MLGAFAVTLTPLKRIMPGSVDSDMRGSYISLSIRIDSLINASRINDYYLNNIQAAISGIETRGSLTDSGTVLDKLTPDSLISPSEEELRFVKKVQEQQQFKLSVLSPIAAEAMMFYTPVTGAVVADVSESYRVSLNTIGPTPVSAAYRGTVIDSYYDMQGNRVMLQHPSGFITLYCGLTDVFVKKGDKVNAGSRIGMANTAHYPLAFEMWHNGIAVKPSDFIKF